jgi:hypothetical protein
MSFRWAWVLRERLWRCIGVRDLWLRGCMHKAVLRRESERQERDFGESVGNPPSQNGGIEGPPLNFRDQAFTRLARWMGGVVRVKCVRPTRERLNECPEWTRSKRSPINYVGYGWSSK